MRDYFEMHKLRAYVYEELCRRDVHRLSDEQIIQLASNIKGRSPWRGVTTARYEKASRPQSLLDKRATLFGFSSREKAPSSRMTSPIQIGNGGITLLMRNSSFRPSQQNLDMNKIKRYAAQMKSQIWDWQKSGSDKIIVDRNNVVMSGHHRIVAAEMAGIKIPRSAIHSIQRHTERISRSWADVSVE